MRKTIRSGNTDRLRNDAGMENTAGLGRAGWLRSTVGLGLAAWFKNIAESGSLLAFIFLCSVIILCPVSVQADDATDEIRNFTITVDVNEDASLDMTYHIEWEVLDDEQYGPLEWVDIGMPGSAHYDLTALTDNIDRIEDEESSVNIYLDRSYNAGETVTFEFSFIQENMYQIDKYTEGETVYAFTPAWFDTIRVDDLTIRWNKENAVSWQPDCLQKDGYLVFETSLAQGETFRMSVVYPNDAYAFSSDAQSSGDEVDDDSLTFEDGFYIVIAILIVIGFFAFPIIVIWKLIKLIGRGLGFGSGQKTEKKITRTRIEYYPVCPGCGAAREEGKDTCAYCGRSMIKSREIIEEKDLKEPEKYTLSGTYRYGSAPDTYILVNVIHKPVRHSGPAPWPAGHRPGGGSHHSGSGSHHSHHSSCACACASSCACACACASSGRAGCSVKDFFRRDLHEGRITVDSRRGSQ